MAELPRIYFGAKTPMVQAAPLEKLCTNYLLALYRRWYGLPLKSTRIHLDDLRAALVTALRDPSTDAIAALRSFTSAAEKLPQVGASVSALKTPLGDLRTDLAELLAARGATLSTEERERLAALAADADPAYAGISRMTYDPQRLRDALPGLRQFLKQQRDRIPAEVNAQVDAIWGELDAGVGQVKLDWGKTTTLLIAAMAKLESISIVLRLLWERLLAIKVESQGEIKRTLGGSDSLESLTAKGIVGGGAKSPLPPAGQPVKLFSDVRFPGVVPVSTREFIPLIVRLTTVQQQESVAPGEMCVPFVDPTKPEYVDVLVSAPGFQEQFDLWRRTIVVYSDQNSQPAIFLLRSSEIGPKRITIDFQHGGRLLASVAFETTVKHGISASSSEARRLSDPLEISGFLESPPPPADLELRIVRGANENTLSFTLHSSKSGVPFHWQPVGETVLAVKDPQEFLEHKFERLSQLAAEDVVGLSDAQIQSAVGKMTAIGEELWEELLPDRFKEQYWALIKPLRERGILRTLLITSDEPWIPWEMVKPWRSDSLNDSILETDDFWAASFQLCRWLAGRGPAHRVDVTTARMIAPDLDLAFVDEEKKSFDSLRGKGIDIAKPLQSKSDVLDLIASGGVELLHFATHGSFDPQNPNRSRVLLADDAALSPEELTGSAVRGLLKSKPVVFMNACSLGRVGFSLTRLGGWAASWINNVRVSAFIGTLWEVNDQLAAEFTHHFYANLFEDKTLGEAFHAARLAVRARQPANPTWLAYTLYGDPNSRVSVKAGL
jgi:hypothetical protein